MWAIKLRRWLPLLFLFLSLLSLPACQPSLVGQSGHIPSVAVGATAYVTDGSHGFLAMSRLALFDYDGVNSNSYILRLRRPDRQSSKLVFLPLTATNYSYESYANGSIMVSLTNIRLNPSDGSIGFDWAVKEEPP